MWTPEGYAIRDTPFYWRSIFFYKTVFQYCRRYFANRVISVLFFQYLRITSMNTFVRIINMSKATSRNGQLVLIGVGPKRRVERETTILYWCRWPVQEHLSPASNALATNYVETKDYLYICVSINKSMDLISSLDRPAAP